MNRRANALRFNQKKTDYFFISSKIHKLNLYVGSFRTKHQIIKTFRTGNGILIKGVVLKKFKGNNFEDYEFINANRHKHLHNLLQDLIFYLSVPV